MIDARFIEAKRRAAKNTADGAPGGRRRRQSHRGGDRGGGNVLSPPATRAPDAYSENINRAADTVPRFEPLGPPRLSPQVQPFVPISMLQKDGHSASTTASVIKPPVPMQSLEEETARLSVRDGSQSPKQGRQRGRNRGRSNMSKHSSPQRTFHGRNSSEDQHVGTTQRSTGSHNDLAMLSADKLDTTRKGVLPISIPSKPSPKPENSLPVVRLPEVIRPAPSATSHDSMNLMRSEDTEFGSYISRGAVQEGRLYNHKQVEKAHSPPKPRDPKPPPSSAEERPQPRSGGLLRIQPRNLEPPKPVPQHRGGLLFIDTNAIKSTNNRGPKQRGNQSEYKRDAVPLRKEPESQSRTVWNPDNIPPAETMLHDGPKFEISAEDILREVKAAYQEIQNLERKVESIYDSQADGVAMSRMQSRSQNDPVTWTKYCKTHNDLLNFYHTFFTMTQHPSASSNIRRLPKKHGLLARYWKYGIVSLLEYFRQKLPISQPHMQSFIYAAYTLTSVLLQDVPIFQAVWMECLGDLVRYLYAIEENDAESKEHWRETASEWYLKTIDVNHGTVGRLYHHLGIISKGDPIMQLFYYAKSLMVVHGFSSARESFLILIDPALGMKASTWEEAFIRLHGMLFARLQLDSFDEEVDSFLDQWGPSSASSTQWALITVTNIAALYQYNRKDSRLKEALRQGRREKRETEHEDSVPAEETTEMDTILPPSQLQNDLQVEMANTERAPDTFANMPVGIRSDDREDVSLSKIVFEKAANLGFTLLSETLNSGTTQDGPLISIHIWLVFLAYALRYQPVVRLMERKFPWQELAELLNDVKSIVDPEWSQILAITELEGPVLLEDPIIRGFEWSRKLFPKGWYQDVNPTEPIEETDDSSEARKQRILSLGIQLTKICDCLELEDEIFRVSDALTTRIATAEAREAEEAERLEQAAQAAREAAMNESLEETHVQPESEEDVDIPGESEEIRVLKARRRELKAMLKAQRPSSRDGPSSIPAKNDKSAHKSIRPGYTILVFDTNLLVSHLDLLRQIVEAGEWQVVVPLIVITELDGLKVNPPPLGTAAAEAISYVEQSLAARKLRVLTQQGSGLTNLAFRAQQLLPRNTEDGAASIDAFIIQTVRDQMEKHSGKVQNVEKAVLVTGDKSMGVIARAKGVHAVTAAGLRKELRKLSGVQNSPKKKAKG